MEKKTIILFHPLIENQYYKCIPYAVLYLERVVRDVDVNLIIIDENVEKNYENIVLNIKENLLFVGISSIIGSQIIGGIRFARFIKSLNPQNIVLWGGWHSTILPEQTLKEDYIDFVITGQGENAFRAFTMAMLNAQINWNNIPNLSYKDNGRLVINQSEPFCDFNSFPPVNYDLVDINNYIYHPEYAKKAIVYFASHGCPYNCNFCAMATYFKQKWIPRNIDTIINDLKYFKEKAGIDSVFFQDDNFFTQKKFCVGLCEALIQSGMGLLWETWSHAGGFLKMFNDDDVDVLYKAGCRQIICGSESGSQKVLDMVNKKLKVEDNIQFVKLLKKHKIIPFFSIMLCFPDNTVDELDETFEMIRKAKLIDNKLKVYFSYYTPYPGTKMFQYAQEKSFKMPENLKDWSEHTFDDFHAPWWTENYESKLEMFAHFYIPLSNPVNYKNFYRPPFIKFCLYLINKIFYPIVILRFKANWFKCPIEAKLFLFLLKSFNKLFKKNYKLYPF